MVAAATHGVIRVGHAVRGLLADGDDPGHLAELAHGLAYNPDAIAAALRAAELIEP